MLADLVQTGLSAWWAPALAFAAGVVSFASPCVFPLVPGYLSFVAGGAGRNERPIPPILLFILGFSVIFTGLGAIAGNFLRVVQGTTGQRVAGVVVLLFGVFMILYALRVGSARLYSEKRPLLSKVRPGTAGALPLGMAFAAGWTPCLGPVLGGILTVAGSQGSALRGGVLLFIYSLGLGVPFFLIGLGVRRLMGALDVLKRNYHWIAGVSGVLMVAIGVLLITGKWDQFLGPFVRLGNKVNLPI